MNAKNDALQAALRLTRVLVTGLLLAAQSLASPAMAGTLGSPTMTPGTATAGQATTVRVTIPITDPKYIAGSANLQRLKPDGTPLSVVGTLRDDGSNGDATAGDKVYTLQFTVNEPAAGTVRYQVSAGFTGELKRTFSTPLTLTINAAVPQGSISAASIAPAGAQAGVALAAIVTAAVTGDDLLVPGSIVLQKLDANGAVLNTVGNLHDDGQNGDAQAGDHTWSLRTTVLENTPGIVNYRVAATVQGSGQTLYSALLPVSVSGVDTSVTITGPVNGAYLNTQVITVSGTVGDPAAQVKVNGIATPVAGKSFSTSVPLNEGPNTVTAVATNSNGSTTVSSIAVQLDTTAPRVQIYSPAAGGSTTASTVTVTGLVNDIVVGTVNPQQATVSVNGIPATIVNRSFQVDGVPLNVGSNTLQAVATDRAGNRATASITVQRLALNANQATLSIVSGNSQSGPVGSNLNTPLVVKLLNAQGQPQPNAPVVFRVISQDGGLSATQAPRTNLSAVAVNTDSQGLARTWFKLGNRAGSGNNLVQASAAGVVSTADFIASGTPGTAALMVVDSGNGQIGTVGQPLPFPFIAIVTDGKNNRLAGVPVTFTVKQGNGLLEGAATHQSVSDSDGRVAVTLTLGPDQGIENNVVEASAQGATGLPAAFTATGLVPGPAAQTRISGVVLDNSNNPIPGVTMRLLNIHQGNFSNIPQQMATPVQTDAQGQFLMTGVPVGVFKLMADGGTAQRPGLWPTLDFDMITVAGQNNTLGMPIFLPEINPNNRLCVNDQSGGVLTIPEVPGFALTIAPGSATFPGGTKTGCVSVTPVNMDKVPMSPGFGQQPRFVVTIQPAGTMFSPPARMSIPNVDGLAPRAVTEMYSYDHDLASFVAIGSATVSEDGSTITSDPGAGVIKAGWHCGGDPNTSGSAGTCPECQKCEGSGCRPDGTLDGSTCQASPMKVCKAGNCVPPEMTVEIVTPTASALSISSVPEMPDATFTARLNSQTIQLASVTFKWYLTINYTGHSRSDSHRIPAQGTIDVTGDVNWKPSWGAVLAGGDVKVFVEALANNITASDQKGGYHINGLNPSETAVKGYLGNSPWFLTRLVRQESSYRQFESSPGNPLFGPPNGWGLTQTDPPPTESAIWNWKSNVDAGKAVVSSKGSSAISFWNRQVAQYTAWIAGHPGTASPPADKSYGDVTFAYAPTGAKKSFGDAIWIKQYNGAPNGNFVAWDNVSDPTSPQWIFHETGGAGSCPNYVSCVCNQAP